ncbi:E3 ubiquitin-protein ligase RNF128-like isoform X3 [Acipenser ruthenus]|uniref:E3 ubiquitin-protein ligase RNF128-like isoform X3 n=1 Tax=Acipenser ruthenus TaxID=7906 RepID=UPI00145AC580|nr:E3 ubiquitin-protein ligase RNF128-like isoform X3 [Acipenser ruthenus]
MGRKNGCCFLLLWFVVFVFQSPAGASVVWTALLEISYRSPGSTETVSEVCECGLYGLDSPLHGASGVVGIPSSPDLDACEADTHFNVSEAPWIALIERGNCTFTDKIKVAVRNGASAVVIFNVHGTGNETRPMVHNGAKDTVAIMVGNSKGMEIVQLMHSGAQVTLTIKVGKQHGPWMSHYSVFFISISFFIVTAAIVGYFIFYSARRLHTSRALNRRQKQLKADAMKAIGQLEVRTLKPGDKEIGADADSCAVCIEVYKLNDVVRILTCNHLFHKTCIDPWLLEHRTCPMCKCDILKALGIEQPDDEEASEPVQSVPVLSSAPESSAPLPTEDGLSETASSGYASVHEVDERVLEEENPIPANSVVRMEVLPHYDNLTFETEEDAPRYDNLQQVQT